MTFVTSGMSLSLCLVLGKSTVHCDRGGDAGGKGRVEGNTGHFQVGQNGEASGRLVDATYLQDN